MSFLCKVPYSVGTVRTMRDKTVVVVTSLEAEAQARVIREIDALVSAGYHVNIVETERVCVDRAERAHGIHKLGVRTSKVPFLTVSLGTTPSRSTTYRLGLHLFYLASSLLYFLTLLQRLIAAVLQEKPQVVLVHNSPDLVGLGAALLNRTFSQEYVYEIHDLTPELYCEKLGIPVQSVVYRILFLLERIAVENARRVIVVNNTMKACLLKRHPMLRIRSVTVLYSSWSKSDIRELRGASASSRQSYDLRNGITLAYSGDMEAERRGISELLQVTRDLLNEGHKIRLLLIGDGEMREFILHYISSNQMWGSVFLTGWLPLKDYVALLSACQVAVIPLRRTVLTNIATPNKLFEYMALEKLVLASRLAGICEVVQEGRNGLLLDPDELTVSLRDQIKRVLLQGIPSRLVANAKRDFDEKFSWETQNIIFLEAIS
jgi:glycosyltransferase involved in cell wall biosynthesis